MVQRSRNYYQQSYFENWETSVLILSLPVPATSLLCQRLCPSYCCFQVYVEILSTWKHPYTIKAIVQAYCGNYVRSSCITWCSVKASSIIAALVNQSETITRICLYYMARVLTQVSKQMIIQINNSGQEASEKEDSPFKGQET